MRSSLMAFVLIIFFLSTSASGQDCADPEGDHGVILYHDDFGVWQGCTPQGWVGLNSMVCPDGDGGADPCSFEGSCSTPSPGTQCGDGSFYIGNSPADGVPVFMTSADYEVSLVHWVVWDGNINPAPSNIDGRQNSENFLLLGGDFPAVEYCENLSGVHGHSDWYLPSGHPTGGDSELNMIWSMVDANGGQSIAGIDVSGSIYWSSRSYFRPNIARQKFDDGAQGFGNGTSVGNVRCFRR